MTEAVQVGPAEALAPVAARARDWLCGVAAPLWSTRGRTPSGLFAERMSTAGTPDSAYFRTFVQARHIFSFVTIGQLGWDGPWRDLVGETVDTLLGHARRIDGLFVHRLDAAANPIDPRADLYDQAFVLLALGVAGKALRRPALFDAAEDLLTAIETQWGHPAGGFREGEIVDARIRRQNPHMHLFEGALALSEASGRARFGALALSIGELAADRMIDPATGALLEYFEEDLSPVAGELGRIVEPGHCFEWAWLFERMTATGWRKGTEISDRLVGFARSRGISSRHDVAINEVLTDGAVSDAKARLWPQTERIKAAVARWRRLGDPAEAKEAGRAAKALERYYEGLAPGLWRDKLCPDGNWIEEPVPGSSLYHISCAYAELNGI